MLEQKRIQSLLTQPEEFAKMLAYKRREEETRIGSDLTKKPFSEFTLFYSIQEDAELLDAFMRMQEIYVFSDDDILQPDTLLTRMDRLTQHLLALDEGLEAAQETEHFAQ